MACESWTGAGGAGGGGSGGDDVTTGGGGGAGGAGGRVMERWSFNRVRADGSLAKEEMRRLVTGEQAEKNKREEIAAARTAVAAERQAQRDHELAMAHVENEAKLIEARAELRHAWHPDSVAWAVAIFSLLSAGLGAAFVAVAHR